MKRDAVIKARVAQSVRTRLEALSAAEDRTLSTYVSRVLENHLSETPEDQTEQDASGDPGYTYFIRSSGYYKVGRARNVPQRLAAMCLPEKPVVIATVLCADYGKLEMALHTLLSHKRVNGEWFLLSETEASAVKLLMESRQELSNVVALAR